MNWIEYIDNLPALIMQYGLNFIAALAIFFIGKWMARRAVGFGGRLMAQRDIDPTVGGFLLSKNQS